jgi:hypothetical protein
MHVVSYNQTIEGLSAIYTAPSALESTSLMLAVGKGGDLFFARVQPSKRFDLLAESFNHLLVSVVLVVAVVGTWSLGGSAKRKTLRESWA